MAGAEVEPSKARILMRDYLKKTPPKNKETGGRKYYTEVIIDRMQRMGRTGVQEFNLDELTTFSPRYDSPPYPPSDMLILEKPSGPSASTDLSFRVGERTYSAPIIYGEYSFGATQEDVHNAVANVALANNFIFGIGEGGRAPSLSDNPNLMVQLATGRFGISIEALNQACIISIKMSQSAKIGMGGHLPKNKVTKTIQQIRGMPAGVDILSDASMVFSIEEMRAYVQTVKEATGKPVFIKVGASHHIAHVAAGAVRAGADGIIIDGRGGGTGAAPNVLRDHVGMPIELAVHLAHKQVQAIGARNVFRIIAAGRVDLPSKAFKLMLLGADGVMLGTGSLIALGCKVVNMCHKECPTALTAIPSLPDGTKKRELDYHWATTVLGNFFRAYKNELELSLSAFGFSTPKEALGRTDLMHAHAMPETLAKMLDVATSGGVFPAPPSDYPKTYLAALNYELSKSGKPTISSMGRTIDLDNSFSNLDLLDTEGRTVVGPAYDTHREMIETVVRLPGKVNISIPLILEDSAQAQDQISRLAREKNTIILSSNAPDPRRRIVPVDMDSFMDEIYNIRESAGVLIKKGQALAENIRELKRHAPSAAVYVSIDASGEIREEVVKLAQSGVDGIIIKGEIGRANTVPLDVAVSQADDALRIAIADGKILRSRTVLVAHGAIRNSWDAFALSCLGADAVVLNICSLVTKKDYPSHLNYLGGISGEYKQLMGAAGLSMMSSIVGNRNILRADHYMEDRIAELLGVDYIGA